MSRFLIALAGLAVVAAACGSATSTPVAVATATAASQLATPSATAEATPTAPAASLPPTATPEPTPAPAASGSPAPSSGGTGDVLQAIAGAKAWLDAPGSVRLDLRMTGTFDAGTADYPWLVDLTDSRITSDFDLTQRVGHIQATIPGMDSFTEDILIIEQVEYARSSLGGNIWTRQAANGAVGSLGQALRDPTGAILMDAVVAGRLTATMAPDATFQGTAAHVVTLAVQVADTYDIEAFVSSTLGSKVGSTPQSGGSSGATKSLSIDLFLAADDLRPLGIQLSMPSGASDPDVAGTKTITIEGTFSQLAEALSVKEPAKWVNGTSPYDPPR